jgi:hypothetical protein
MGDKKTIRARLKLYKPHAKQLEFHNSNARFKVAALGRQAGKSTMALNELCRRAWEKPNTTYWFVSPTFNQSTVQYRRLVGMLYACPEVFQKKNQTELRVKLINNSQIRFVSGESLHNLRGETLHGAVIDEVRDQDPELWPQVIRPMLATTGGWASFVSTPRGFDMFYDLFERSKTDSNWAGFQAPSACNPLFTEAEMEEARKELSEPVFAQEILAQFRDLYNGAAYINFSDANMKSQSPFTTTGALYSPHLPILLGVDFNLDPMAWILGQTNSGQYYFFDELFLRDSHTQEAAQELVHRIKQMDIKAKPMVRIAGDASGRAGQRAAFGRSDYSILEEILKANNISFENVTPAANPEVRDRVNLVNAKLKGSDGQPHVFVHPNCKMLRKDLQRVGWKRNITRGALDQTSDPTLTHISDAMGYSIAATSRMWQPSAGGVFVLRR